MIYDSIIIGAGPASLSAALYLKNANKNILILENNQFKLLIFSLKIILHVFYYFYYFYSHI